MEGEFVVCAAQDGNEVIFEGLDGLLCTVAAVVVWRDELVGNLVGFDCVLEFVGALVVENVLRGGDASCI